MKIWRRSFDVKPPALDPADERSPLNQPMYRDVDRALLPAHESLETTIARAVPYFNEVIKPEMLAGKRVIIAAHGTSTKNRNRMSRSVRLFSTLCTKLPDFTG